MSREADSLEPLLLTISDITSVKGGSILTSGVRAKKRPENINLFRSSIIKRLKSGLPFKVMASSAESALEKLGYKFFKNDFGHTVEFGVEKPATFSVLVQKLDDTVYHSALLGGLVSRNTPGRTNLSIVLGGESSKSKRHAVLFVIELLAALPREPWKGLGFIESLTAKSLWKRWAAGLEER